jgi:hypothetical protein
MKKKVTAELVPEAVFASQIPYLLEGLNHYG